MEKCEEVCGNICHHRKDKKLKTKISAESREQVDDWESEVGKAGGTIISHAEEFGKGYYGFVFADPDGHKFNVFYM